MGNSKPKILNRFYQGLETFKAIRFLKKTAAIILITLHDIALFLGSRKDEYRNMFEVWRGFNKMQYFDPIHFGQIQV